MILCDVNCYTHVYFLYSATMSRLNVIKYLAMAYPVQCISIVNMIKNKGEFMKYTECVYCEENATRSDDNGDDCCDDCGYIETYDTYDDYYLDEI